MTERKSDDIHFLIQQKAILYFDQGKTIPEIAELLNIGRIEAINQIPNSKITDKIETLLKQHLTITEIGRIIGITGKTIKRYMDEENIQNPNIQLAIKLFLEYGSIREVATRLQNTKPTSYIANT
jgi:DNA invertase Pin-like site-specific DNA recombinase